MHLRVARDLQDSPQDSAKIIAKRLKVTPKEVLESYEGLKLPTPEENKALLSSDSDFSKRIPKMKEFLILNKIINDGEYKIKVNKSFLEE